MIGKTRQPSATLPDDETVLVDGGSEAGDAETLIRYRASLPEKEAKREGSKLLSAAYGEAEERGANPWRDEDFGALAGELERRGIDVSGVRYFSK